VSGHKRKAPPAPRHKGGTYEYPARPRLVLGVEIPTSDPVLGGRTKLSDIHDLLKTKTAPLREQLERLPFFEALQTHTLPKVSIVSFLRCLAIIHAVLERKLSRISQHQVSRLHDSTLPKLPLLVADLEILDAASLPGVAHAIRNALDHADEILRETDPLNLIGPLFVLEGTPSGASALKHEYARCLNVRDEQLSYLGCYGSAPAAACGSTFLRVLSAISFDGGQRERIAESAVRCFECLEGICAAVYPYSSKDLKYHAAAMNFEAGDHAVPQNPIEIDLALRAAKAAWEKFSYLEQRYGARGKRFTNSDSCWLVTLTHAPGQDVATKTLDWLRTVLATRGIPTVVLEVHLRTIQQAIALEFPEQIKMRAQFDLFLSNREAERRMYFGAEGQSPLIDAFNRRFQACGGLKVESAADLIASAWMDERSGVTGSLSALHNWITDVGRFSKDWIANVNELFAELDLIHT
jgi:heme oxygenase